MLPKISCLCITHNRKRSLERAIACFEAQEYSNKELFILYESEDVKAAKTLSNYKNHKNIALYEVPSRPKLVLGELRNIAIRESSGDFFCQWDDDDWYSVDRLEAQYNHIITNNKLCCVLNNWIVFDSLYKQAFLSIKRLWEGSILCNKKALNGHSPYLTRSKGEDTHFIKELDKRDLIVQLDRPDIYIYIYDGKNTWERDHWQKIFDTSVPITKDLSMDIWHILEGRCDPHEGSYRLKQICLALEK